MFEAMAGALGTLVSAEHLLYLAAGVLLGLAVGIFPGLGGIAGLALLLPFLYGLDPVSGLAMMIGPPAWRPCVTTAPSLSNVNSVSPSS